MKILRLRFKNLFCFGNILQDIDFDKKNSLTQICAKNGLGKSTIIRIIKLLAYGETDGIVIREIANEINGDGWGELTIDSNGHIWKIVGEFTTKMTLKVYKDNNEKPEDWGSETKTKLKSEVVDIPYYVFSNVLLLSIVDIKSFIGMNAKDSRNIRDRIFSFHVINKMLEMLRIDMNKDVESFKMIDAKIAPLEQNIENQKEELAKLQAKFDENNKQKIEILKTDINTKQLELHGLMKTLDSYKNNISECENALKFFRNKERDKKISELESYNTELDKTVQEELQKENSFKKIYDDLVKDFEIFKSKNRFADLQKKEEEYQKELLELQILSKESVKSQIDYNESTKKIQELQLRSSLDSIINQIKIDASLLLTTSNQYISVKERFDVVKEVKKKLEIDKEKIQESEIRAKNTREQLTRDIALFETGTCPTCKSDLTQDNHKQHLDDMKMEFEKLQEKEKNLAEFKVKFTDNKASNDKEHDELFQKGVSLIRDINSLISKIKSSIANHEHFSIMKPIFDVVDNSPKNIIENLTENLINGLSIDFDVLDYKKAIDENIILKQKHEENLKIFEQKNNDVKTKHQIIDSLKKGLPENVGDLEARFGTKEEYETEINSTLQLLQSKKLNESKLAIDRNKLNIDSIKSQIENITNIIDYSKGSKEHYEQLLVSQNTILTDTQQTHDKVFQEIRDLKYQIIQIESLKIDEQLDFINNSIKNTQQQIDSEVENKKTLIGKINYHKQLEYIYSDEGIKAYILRDIVPSINYEINRILGFLGVNLSLEFDDEFTTHIHRNGREASIKSISKGQSDMLNCATIIAMTKILKLKYGNVNVVFYDEIFSSLHETVRPLMLEILRDVCGREMNMNVFVINHSYLPLYFFDNIYEIVSINKLSTINQYTVEQYEDYLNNIGVEKKENKLVVEEIMLD